MKKVCSLICLILTFLSLALPVGAEETAPAEDSIIISDEILSCLDESEVDTIFRVYDMNDGYAGFVKYGDIDGVLANTTAPQLRIYYFVKNKQGETASYTYDGTRLSKTQYHSGWGSGWYGVHGEKAESVIKKIAEDIVVENMYFLWYDSGFTVYYKTNLGDYVYLRSSKKEYLMGLEQFVSLQGELHDLGIKYKNMWTMIGCPPEPTFSNLRVDLSPYDITSPDFDPHAPFKTYYAPGKFIAIGSLVLLTALVICRMLICNHRKRRKREDISVNRL